MKAVNFKEVNVIIAKDQPEYNQVPAHVTEDGTAIMCFRLEEEEIRKINETGVIWMHQLTFNRGLNPFNIFAVRDYFKSVELVDGGFILKEGAHSREILHRVVPKTLFEKYTFFRFCYKMQREIIRRKDEEIKMLKDQNSKLLTNMIQLKKRKNGYR